MVVHGGSDPLVPLVAGKDVANAVPKADLCVIKGMGHHISMEFVDEIVDCVIKNTRKAKS